MCFLFPLHPFSLHFPRHRHLSTPGISSTAAARKGEREKQKQAVQYGSSKLAQCGHLAMHQTRHKSYRGDEKGQTAMQALHTARTARDDFLSRCPNLSQQCRRIPQTRARHDCSVRRTRHVKTKDFDYVCVSPGLTSVNCRASRASRHVCQISSETRVKTHAASTRNWVFSKH